MSWVLSAIATGLTAFVATNIDDIIILTLFFAQVNANFKPRHIIVGQYLGFIALIILSLPGFFGGLIVPKAWIGLLGLVPIAIGISQLLNRDKDLEEIKSVSGEQNNKPIIPLLSGFLNPQTLNVAAVTVANGGDNVGVYVPLFASCNLASLGVILSVFFLLVGVWCIIAYLLTRHRAIANLLTRYGNAVAPFVLIGLGIFILLDSGTYRLILPIQ